MCVSSNDSVCTTLYTYETYDAHTEIWLEKGEEGMKEFGHFFSKHVHLTVFVLTIITPFRILFTPEFPTPRLSHIYGTKITRSG